MLPKIQLTIITVPLTLLLVSCAGDSGSVTNIDTQTPNTSEPLSGIPQNNPDTTQNNPVIIQNSPDTTQDNPVITQNEPDTTQDNPVITQNEPDTTQNNPVITQDEPDVTQHDTDSSALTGVIQFNKAIEGLEYRTESQSGVTNKNGEFAYREGEDITFSIGALDFPAFKAKDSVSVIDFSSNIENYYTADPTISRLLLGLDIDGNRDNGISIPPQAATYATQIDFELNNPEFGSDPAVVSLIENSGSVSKKLPPISEALNYLYKDSLPKLNYDLNVVQPVNGTGNLITLAEPYFDYGDIPGDHKLQIEAIEGNFGGFELIYDFLGEPFRSALVINPGTTIKFTYLLDGVPVEPKSGSSFFLSGVMNEVETGELETNGRYAPGIYNEVDSKYFTLPEGGSYTLTGLGPDNDRSSIKIVDANTITFKTKMLVKLVDVQLEGMGDEYINYLVDWFIGNTNFFGNPDEIRALLRSN